MLRFLLICLGGAAGTGARYLISTWIATRGPEFPFGTLTVNVLGSFLLGALMHVGIATDWIGPTTRLALTTGVMGGFTTYSTFNYETLSFFEQGAWALGGLNAAATFLGCLGAGAAGAAVGRLLVGG